MTKKNSIKKNYLYNLIYQILLIILPIITIPYLSRVLGAENIGINSYTMNITSYFILFGSLGTIKYGQREIAYSQNDKNKRSVIFFEILLIRILCLGLSMISFFLVFVINSSYRVYYTILLFEIIANCFDVSWFFQGLEEFKKTVIRNVFVKLLSVIMTFIFVKSSNDLIKYMIIYVSSTFLGNISLWFYLPHYIDRINIKKIKIFKHFKSVIGLFVPQIAIQLYMMIDKTMIGTIISDKSEVGYYDQAQKVVKILLTLAIAIENVMAARIANVFATDSMEKVFYYIKRSFQFVLFLAIPLSFGLYGVSNRFVPLFFGQGYDKVIVLLRTICPIIVLMSISNIIGMQYLLSTKKQKEFTISVVSGAIINICLNYFLIIKHQSIGASIASVISESVVVIVDFYVIRKDLSVLDIFKMCKWYLLGGIIILFDCILCNEYINSSLLCLIIQVCSSCLLYIGLLFIVKDGLLQEGMQIIKSKIKVINNSNN